jgi:hypothetical protein
MRDRDQELLGILRIGHETSMRGAGLSLREALRRTQYKDRRASFGSADLLPLVNAHQALSEDWLAYSDDKRTNGGWYLLRSAEIGRVGDPDSRESFEGLEEAVAEYVVRELDFWADLQEAG